MSSSDPPEDIDQQIRINELRETAREMAGGEMTTWENDETPPEVSEQFWQNVVDYENAEETCHFKQLAERGVQLPDPQELDDARLNEKLWELIRGLAAIDVYLYNTDHLSDRELYTLLWEELLWEITPDLPPGGGWRCHLDILGSGSEEDIYLHLKHYADEEDRERWRKDWPDFEVPEHVDPPYNRDCKLPQAEH